MIGLGAISAADADNVTADTQISDSSSQVSDAIGVDASDNNIQDEKTLKTEKTVKKDGESGTLSDLESDINAAETTLTLSKDYTSSDSEEPFVINKNITIDGNSKTITAVNGAFNISADSVVTVKNVIFAGKNGVSSMITNNGTLNLENVTFNEIFSNTYANPAVIGIGANANATIINCNINNTCSTKSAVAVYANSNTIINGTNFTNIKAKNSAVATYGNYFNLVIDGCYFYNSTDANYGAAIYVDNRGNLTVNNTVIENCTCSYRGAIYVASNATFENNYISGTTFTYTGNYIRPSGVWINHATADIKFKNNTFVTSENAAFDEGIYIYNGIINSTVNVVVADVAYDEEEEVILKADVTDDNGNKIGGKTVTFQVEDKTFTGTLENGTATATATGLGIDNKYTVTASYVGSSEENQIVTEGTLEYGSVLPAMTDYTSLQEVIDDQTAGATIKLKEAITRAEEETNVIINKDITINGKGVVIDASQGTVFELTNGATVTIKNLVITNAKTTNIFNITNANVVLDNVTVVNSTISHEYTKEGVFTVLPGSSLVVNNSLVENVDGSVLYANGTNTIVDNTAFNNITSSQNNNALVYVLSNLSFINSNFENSTGYTAIFYSTASSSDYVMSGTFVVDNSAFINNTISYGWAVINVGNNTNISNSRFIANKNVHDDRYAAALVITGEDSVMNVTDSIFKDNTATANGTIALVGANAILDMSNNIILSGQENSTLFTYGEDSTTYLNGNYWGTNDNPIEAGLVITEEEVYDDWDEDWVTYTYNVTLNDWIIQETTLTVDADDNTIFAIETTFKSNNTEGSVSELTENIPELLEVAYEATSGSFDAATVAVSENKASNTFYIGMNDATVTVTVPNQVQTFDITAPEIDPKDYKGLQKLLTATADGTTYVMEKDCTRGESENNISIANKTIVIDGNGYTIDENGGRLFLIQDANVTLKNLIIKNAGSTYNPSLLQIWTGNLVMENVTIIDSTSSSTGALVYVSADSNATINNVTFENNTARFISTAGTTSINNSAVKNTEVTSSYWGYNNGALTIENTVFDSNTGYTGSISTGTSSAESLVLNNVTFTNNEVTSASSEGGLIHSNGPLTITNSDFENNSVAGTSTVYGLIYVKSNSIVDNSTFINNKVSSTSTSNYKSVAGVFYLNGNGKTLNITKSVFINNTGATKGNVLYNYYGIFNISNSILIDNNNETDTVALYNYDTASYADNNYWGTNDSPRDFVYEAGSRYTISTDTWVILNITDSDVVDDQITITTALNQVTDSEGTVSDLVGSLPEVEVTYDAAVGTLTESTDLVDGVSTATVQTSEEEYDVNVTILTSSQRLTNIDPIIVTEESYSTYFNDDGTTKDTIKANRVVFISGNLSNKTFIFDKPETVTTYNQSQANLTNSKFIFNEGASGSTMSNIIINDTDFTNYVIYVDHADNIVIDNVTINQENVELNDTHSIGINYGENVTIKNSSITTVGKCLNINYTSNLSNGKGFVYTSSIYSLATKNLVIDSNKIVTNQTGNASEYGTIEGLDLRGNTSSKLSNASIVNNEINTESTVYTYGLVFNYWVEDAVVDNNTINSYSKYYSNGIEAFNTSKTNITNNIINAYSEEFAYGIYLSGMLDWDTFETLSTDYNYVSNNTIVCNSSVAYVIELYMSPNNTFEYNNLTANANYSIGIAGSDSGANEICYNDMELNNAIQQTTAPSYDSINSYPAGVKFVYGYMAQPGYNTITSNNIVVNTDTDNVLYAVNLTDTNNNIVTDNLLVGKTVYGDAAVYTTSTNDTVGNNYPVGDLIITNDTYSQYFDEIGIFKVKQMLEGSSVYLSGDFTDKTFIFTIPVDVTTDVNQAVLNNSMVMFAGDASGSNISNIEINDKDYTIYALYLDNVDDITIENITINQENTELNDTHSIGILYGENITIKNSSITTVGQCLDVQYDANSKSTVLTSSIYALATKDLVIDSNTIVTNQTGNATSYGTIEGLDLRGNALNNNNDPLKNARIVNNVINTESTVYTYGLVFNDIAVDCVVDNNTINSYSKYYSNGIEAFNTSKANITNNTINAISAEFAYGIFLSGMYDWNNYETHQTDYNYVANNTVTCNSSVAYVIELYMSPHNTFEYNNLTANSNYSIGIAGSDSGYSTISYNNIELNNAMTQSTVPTYDSIDSYPAGLKFVYAYMAQAGYNTISYNNITINSDTDDQLYTVNLTTTRNNEVMENMLLGKGTFGDDSVFSSSSNTVEDNKPAKLTMTVDEVVGIIKENTTITANVVSEDGETVQVGSVVFKDAEGNIIGEADVVDGVASIVVKYNKELETTVTAEFTCDYTELTANNTLTISKAETTITVDEITASAGQTVTLTANVLSGEDLVNGGKVVFKVNGKTLKDENGKVMYAKVVDGVATVNYTIPDDYAGKTLNITAVYSGTSKYASARSEGTIVEVSNKELTLEIDPVAEAQAGSEVTISAKVKAGDENVSTGKVVFKLNGKTLKDANGKIIYATVVDGIASVNYTIPDTFKAGTYTLSAIFTSSNYNKTVTNTTITVN